MFLRIELGPGRGHFSLENGLSDTWIAKFSRCARLRTWGSAPQDQETTSRTLTPSLWRRRRHPVSLDRGPRGPQEAEKCFVFVFYAGGPGSQKWQEGRYLPRDQHRSALLAPASEDEPPVAALPRHGGWALAGPPHSQLTSVRLRRLTWRRRALAAHLANRRRTRRRAGLRPASARGRLLRAELDATLLGRRRWRRRWRRRRHARPGAPVQTDRQTEKRGP